MYMMESDIANDYNEHGIHSDWHEKASQVYNDAWTDRNYELFKELGIIPSVEGFKNFKLLISASNVPSVAFRLASNISNELEKNGEKIPESDKPIVIATDVAYDPLSKDVEGEKELGEVKFSRVNANSSNMPFTEDTFNVIIDYQGALWFGLENGDSAYSVLLSFYNHLRDNGYLIIDDTFRGYNANQELFTGGKMEVLGFISEDNEVHLGDGMDFEVTRVQGEKDIDSFLVLKKLSR